jgi:alpha-ketoglutarate-dependent taurine dioxygenase
MSAASRPKRSLAAHDLVLWDNLAVLDRGTPFLNSNERHHIVRTTLVGVMVP